MSTTDYEAYTYDANGNRLTLRKRDGSVIGYTYDALNRVTVKDIPGGTAADVYYSYDVNGLQTAALFGSTSGAGLTQSYDGFGRLASATNTLSGSALTLSYQYDADGNRIRVTHPGGTYFTFDYDGLDRQVATRENGSTAVATVTYDNQGRRGSDIRGAVGSTYGYDGVSRLTSLADDLAGTTSDVTTTLAYNPASQIVTRTRSNDAYAFGGYVTVSRNYVANGLNQYTTAGPASFTYDAKGNLTGDGTSTFGYDVENRLVSRSGGLTLSYDPNGGLWQTSGGASGTTRYLYDGDELAVEYDGASNVLRRYVHGPGEDDPILWYEGAGLTDRRSLQVDHQGSIVSIASVAGSALAINAYDEYGIPNAGNIGRFQYTGQAWLPDLGMYYYKARIYSPTLGRFLQTDPIGYKDQVNLYAYVGNDPMDRTDPSGLYECTGSKTNCGSVAANYARAQNSLKSDKLSKSDRLKITASLKALGAPGEKNGVKIGFDSKENIAKQNNGRDANGFTKPGKDGVINVTLRNDYFKLYEGLGGTIAGRDYSRTSARDERSGIIIHEGIHVEQFQNGLTLPEYWRNQQKYENPAYETGKLINKANGSVSVYDLP